MQERGLCHQLQQQKLQDVCVDSHPGLSYPKLDIILDKKVTAFQSPYSVSMDFSSFRHLLFRKSAVSTRPHCVAAETGGESHDDPSGLIDVGFVTLTLSMISANFRFWQQCLVYLDYRDWQNARTKSTILKCLHFQIPADWPRYL